MSSLPDESQTADTADYFDITGDEVDEDDGADTNGGKESMLRRTLQKAFSSSAFFGLMSSKNNSSRTIRKSLSAISSGGKDALEEPEEVNGEQGEEKVLLR